MEINLYKTIKADRKTLKKQFSEKKSDREILQISAEHYPMLDRCALQSATECKKAQKHIKDPELLPGLFDKCNEMCGGGVLPDSDGIVDFFSGELDGISISYLPLAVTCALIHLCAKALMSDNSDLFKKAVLSLQKMRDTDFEYISERLFSCEKILMSDPGGIYSDSDSKTKERYRKKLASLAAKEGKTERESAESISERARKDGSHMGNYLFSTVKSKKRGTVYLILEAVLPALVCISAGILSGKWLFAVLLYLPLWEILRYSIEKASLKGCSQEKLLRLDPNSDKVLKTHALITLSVILPSADKMDDIRKKLEDLYRSNADGNIKICCLADFKAADTSRKPEDKYILNALNNIVDDLNKKYGGGFIAAVRPRSYSGTQNEFIGKERKRGAIRELIRAIKGNEKGFLSINGDTEHLKKTKYLVALDYDTRPVFDSVRDLIAIAEHPVNQPVIKNGRVVSGYGILAPKAQNSLSCIGKTFFSSIMSQNAGISSYYEMFGERYGTVFGESIFCGKGLINVDAYYELLDNSLPTERILSHDIIEGEYLRTAFVPDVQIIEDFPATADAYYKRLHRWVRGDWQNSGFVFGKNALSFVSRFKIFDNLRRSITPFVCLAVIIFSAFFRDYTAVAAAVISAFALCSAEIFSGISSVLHNGPHSITGLYYSKRLPEALGCFLRAFISVAYSAREATVCFDAIFRALWRMLISGDKLLEWTTSASEEQKNGSGLLVHCLPATVVAVILIIFGFPVHRMIGLIILADIPLSIFGNTLLNTPKTGITAEQKDYLLSHVSAMWKYFEDLCGKENNCLPPDNIQFAPHRAVAQRTSPTNIGLMLTCFVAARDFGLITTKEMCERLNLSLSSIEKLEKYKGNLFNWYSTSTLETLEPRFVSAVDCGNFLCCLTAVKEGLREYEGECDELKKTVDRIEKIIDSSDLSAMYNRKRRLFYIGINPDSGKTTESCYDLYMSEIRMTAYFAVARKVVPKNHWVALDRPIIRSGRYMGLASWTGTMFEYFMSDIFVPSPYGSLSDEALRFCFQRQRKKAGKNPFGISESAFYAFDGDLNYQYKAHGVQKLALKRNLDKENVISPYSSFLTLNIAPQLSLRNLKKLEKLGMAGKYGFYEAADFTHGRNSGSFSLINSFMVHHIGMSFLSVDNLLNNRCMQKRFMNDLYMSGAQTLLEEKAVFGKEVFKDIVSDTVIPNLREKVRAVNDEWAKSDKDLPVYSVLANNRMTLCLSDSGLFSVFVDGERLCSLQKMSDRFVCQEENYCFCQTNSISKRSYDAVEYKTDYEEIKLCLQIYLLRTENCFIRKYTIENRKNDNVKGKLTVDMSGIKNKRLFSSGGFLNDEFICNDGVFEAEVEILSGKKKTFTFAYSVDFTEEETVNVFESLKTQKTPLKKSLNPFYKEQFQKALSEKYLSDIIDYQSKESKILTDKSEITEEYPVILVKIKTEDDLESARQLVIFNKNLRNCGIKNTLIIYDLTENNKKTSALQTIETILHEVGCELMLGISGGVYVLNGKNHKNSDYERIKSKSAVLISAHTD